MDSLIKIPNALLVVDGNYATWTFRKFKGVLDYGLLLDWLENLKPNANESIHFGSLKYYMDTGYSTRFQRYLRELGFQAPDLKVKKKSFICQHCNKHSSSFIQANVDIEIAITILDQGIHNEAVKYIFLFSGDGDFVRVLEKMKTVRNPKYLFLIGVKDNTNLELQTIADSHLEITLDRCLSLSQQVSISKSKMKQVYSSEIKIIEADSEFVLGQMVKYNDSETKSINEGMISEIRKSSIVVQSFINNSIEEVTIPRSEAHLLIGIQEDEERQHDKNGTFSIGMIIDYRSNSGKWIPVKIVDINKANIQVQRLQDSSKKHWINQSSIRVHEFPVMTEINPDEDYNNFISSSVWIKLNLDWVKGEVIEASGRQFLVKYHHFKAQKSKTRWFHIHGDDFRLQ